MCVCVCVCVCVCCPCWDAPAGVGSGGLFFLSQRPYIPQASLRQQVLYPTPAVEVEIRSDQEIEVRGLAPAHALLLLQLLNMGPCVTLCDCSPGPAA
jgi:hypothetical protein